MTPHPAIEMAKLRKEIAELRRDVAAVKSMPTKNPLPHPGGRICFNCGAAGMCKHREPEVIAAEYARLMIGLGANGRVFE